MTHEGGCLCGEVQYMADAAPRNPGYCHCRLCQKSTGAPVAAFATVPVSAFRFLKGSPQRYRSSTFAERWFCGRCSSLLAMRLDREPESLDLAIACLDEPARVAPRFHIWHSARIDWFETADDLERYPEERLG